MNIPCPPLDPLLGRYTGHALQLFHERFLFMKKCVQKYGSIVRLRYMDQPVWLISDPVYLEKIFKDETLFTRRTLGNKKFEYFIGAGSVTLEGDEWLKRRKINQPYFNQKMINSSLTQYKNILEKKTQNLEGEIDVTSFAGFLALDFISSGLFKLDLKEKYHDFISTLDGILEAASYQISKTFPFPLPKDFFIHRKAQGLMLKVKTQVRSIISECLLSDENNVVKDLNSAGTLSTSELEEEVRTLVMAGFETSATTLTWCLWELTKNPEWLKKIRAEYDQHYHELSTLQDLPARMIHTQAFLLEILRFYSPIWSASRKANVDCQVEDIHFKKGDLILISPYMCHHNPKNYEEAEEFKPERFLLEGKIVEPRAFFPFGYGPRACVGKQMAMTSLTLTLAHMAGKFDLESKLKEVTFLASITLRPKEKIKMKVKARGTVLE